MEGESLLLVGTVLAAAVQSAVLLVPHWDGSVNGGWTSDFSEGKTEFFRYEYFFILRITPVACGRKLLAVFSDRLAAAAPSVTRVWFVLSKTW